MAKGPRANRSGGGPRWCVATAALVATTWAPSTLADGARVDDAAWTASPVSLDDGALDPSERDVLARCGTGEAGLRRVALGLVERTLHGEALPELDGLARALRAAGEPHPWPRAWAVRGKTIDSRATLDRLDAWLGADAVPGRRCGIARARALDGTLAMVVVSVEALADLAPLPTHARTGQWLTLDARLLRSATAASVFVMRGAEAPRTIPSWIDAGRLRARFAADGPGEIDVQVVATLPSGPRPVLEATVLVDGAPPAVTASAEDRGEVDAPGVPDDVSLAHRVDRARETAGLAPLRRDACLDRVARAHADAMARRHELAHDAGDGDPLERLRVAGLDPRAAAENVAHAATVGLADRALWASPSHRMNLLGRAYDRVGVGVVRDAQGDVWVTETFTGGPLADCAGL